MGNHSHMSLEALSHKGNNNYLSLGAHSQIKEDQDTTKEVRQDIIHVEAHPHKNNIGGI